MRDEHGSNYWFVFCITIIGFVAVLYFGSYFALVLPGSSYVYVGARYKYGGSFANYVYLPIEQADRKLRPNIWYNPWEELTKRRQKSSNSPSGAIKRSGPKSEP